MIPLENYTNGEIIQTILKPRTDEVKIRSDYVEIEMQKEGINFDCPLDWWNAHYKK